MDETPSLQSSAFFPESRKNFLKEKVSPETLENIQKEREKLTKEMVASLLEHIQANIPVKECTDLADILGIEKPLHSELKKIWNKTSETDITASETHKRVTQALVTLGDEEVFQAIISQKEKLDLNDLAFFCAEYAQAGHQDEVIKCIESFSFFEPENETQASEFFSTFIQKIDAEKAPNLSLFCYDLMKKIHILKVPYESFIYFEDTVFVEKVKRGENKEVLEKFGWQKHQKTAELLLQGENFHQVLDIFTQLDYDKLQNETLAEITRFLARNVTEKGSHEIWLFLEKNKTHFIRAQLEHTLEFLYSKVASFVEPGTSFSKEITQWILKDPNWPADSYRVNAFTALYNSKKFPEFSQEYEEKVYKKVEKSSVKGYSGNVELWVQLVVFHGVENPLAQKLFDLFEKDDGVFSPDQSNILEEILIPLISEGKFLEAENLIRRKTSHFSYDRYIKNIFRKTPSAVDFVKGNFKMRKMENFLEFSTLGTKILEHSEEYEKFLEKQPVYIKRLWTAALDQFGLLHPSMTNLFEGKTLSIKLQKTGSELHIISGKNLGVIVNDIPEASLTSWEAVQKAGVPVAPIFKIEEKPRQKEIKDELRKKKTKKLKRVYSRFCGMTAEDYLKKYPTKETSFFLAREMDKIRQSLKTLNVEHGHPHLNNFTIEFWNTEFWEGERAKGINPNEIQPINPVFLSFEPKDYHENPEKWTPVVRLIDWDQSSSSSPTPS